MDLMKRSLWMLSATLGVGLTALPLPAPAASAAAEERALSVPGPVPLPAVLSVPAGPGPFPAVVLVHGSGPADKDLRIGEARPFLDLARGLSQRGVAVLRYDKRTQISPATPVRTVADEVTDDARAALRLLAAQPRVDARRIYLLGYDLGGHLAPQIAADPQTPMLAGVIFLCAAARPLWEQHVEQVRRGLQVNGALSAEARRQLKVEEAAARRIQSGPLRADESVALLGRPTPGSYWLALRPYSPPRAARPLRVPLLLLFGERDELVTAADRELWQKGLQGKDAVTFKTYPGLSHLLRAASGQGEIADLDRPGAVAPEVSDDIAAWIARAASAPR